MSFLKLFQKQFPKKGQWNISLFHICIFCLYFVKLLYDLHLAKQHRFKIKYSFLGWVVTVSKVQCAIMMADKSCHCDKAYSELRSRDGVRLTKAKKSFFFLFLSLLRTSLLEKSSTLAGGRVSCHCSTNCWGFPWLYFLCKIFLRWYFCIHGIGSFLSVPCSLCITSPLTSEDMCLT